MKFDLHIHTNYSDGKLSLENVIKQCNDKGIDFISITDHDCVDAYYDKSIEKYKGILIPGAEFSADWKIQVHILGYNIDVFNEKIKSVCENIKQNRMQELMKLLKKLKDIGISIPMSELRNKGRINMDTLAQCMFEMGYGESPSKIRRKYLGSESNLYVAKKGVDIKEVIEAIHDAGGKAVFAHPGRYSNSIDELKDMIIQLSKYGLDGVEVYSPHNDKNTIEHLLCFCLKNNLIYTGGSDFHNNDTGSIGMENSDAITCITNTLLPLR